MPSNQDWCNVLFRHYFNRENEGKEVLLYCDRDVIIEVGKKAVASGDINFESLNGKNDDDIFLDFERKFGDFTSPVHWINQASQYFYHRKKPAGEPYGPEYFIHLLLTILAVSEYDRLPEEEARRLPSSAYYERLAKYFQKINAEFAQNSTDYLVRNLGVNFGLLQYVWRDLETYVNKTLKGEYGVWHLNQDDKDPRIHVRIPLSQLIFKPIHRSRDLPEFFRLFVKSEPEDWNEVVKHPEFKRKFEKASKFENPAFVVDFVKSEWTKWNEERQKEGDKSSSYCYDGGTVGIGSQRNIKKLKIQSGKKTEIVSLFWCFELESRTLKLFPATNFEHEGKTYAYGRAISRQELKNIEAGKKIRFRYTGKSGLRRLVALTTYSELEGADYAEFVGENIQSLQGEDVVFVCPPEKQRLFEENIAGFQVLADDQEAYKIYRCHPLKNASVLIEHLGFQPRIRGNPQGIEPDKEKRTFLNIVPVVLEIEFLQPAATVVAKSETGQENILSYHGENPESGIHAWAFPAFFPAGNYIVYAGEKPLNKIPIRIVEAEIHPKVGVGIPWRNVYGERCDNENIPCYRGLQLNDAALGALNFKPMCPLIAEILQNLDLNLLKTNPLPSDVFIPQTPADLMLYWLTFKNELSWWELKEAKQYFESEAEGKIYYSRFEPHGYLDVDWESEDPKTRVKVLPPTLVSQYDNPLKFAYVGARTPQKLREIFLTATEFNLVPEYKSAKGLPTAVYLTFKSAYDFCKFARKTGLQCESDKIEIDLNDSSSGCVSFSELIKLISLDIDAYLKKTDRKNKLKSIDFDLNKINRDEWEYFDANQRAFMPMSQLKSAKLRKVHMIRKAGKEDKEYDWSSAYFKEKNSGKTNSLAKAYLLRNFAEFMFYHYLAQATKSGKDWWKKVFELDNKDEVLRVRNEVGLPRVLDKVCSLMCAEGTDFQNARGEPSNSRKKYRAYRVSKRLYNDVMNLIGMDGKKKPKKSSRERVPRRPFAG